MTMRMGDYGSVIRIIAVDAETGRVIPLDGVTATIRLRLDGVSKDVTADVVDADNGVIEYTIAEGDLNSYGTLEIQGIIDKEGEFHLTGSKVEEQVEDVLAAPPEPGEPAG